MASSSPVRVGAVSQTTVKTTNSTMARETHVYKTTEEITVAQLYEDAESGYAGIAGTSSTDRTLSRLFMQSNLNLYDTNQRLIDLYLKDQFKGIIIKCSGTMTMTMLASLHGIKKSFVMEVN
ncbi:hypothetical protein BGZ88_004313, partial [Linnemannia elongata]